jgi:hypothetical protein
MKLAIALFAALSATAVLAQDRGSFSGPFTGFEAEALSDVWSEIREAADFGDIDWSTHGLARAPGSPEARRVLADNWDDIRREERFEDIDWGDYDYNDTRDRRANRARQSDRFERRFPGPFSDVGPFTRDEAQALSEVWPTIREAAEFDDIDWRAHGFARAPGNSDARAIMAENWDELRRAERFSDIDWDDAVDERDLTTSRRYAGGFGTSSPNPFTREESATMSRIWPEIRVAAEFDDIDWQSVGLLGPPGDREARRILAAYWPQLRVAERFDDIDWAATTGTRSRVLR